MHSVPQTPPATRHDGWTPERRQEFLAALAAGLDVSRACARVGLSREAAYKLRRRDPAFAGEWHDALRTARDAGVEAFLASLPDRILRTLSDSSTPRQLRLPAGRRAGVVSG